MNLFKGKARTICMCNIMVPFVCTGLLGVQNYGVVSSSTTDEAHEISLTVSDTEPVSQCWEGEENDFAFIIDGVEALIDQQELADSLEDEGEENDFAFIIDGVEALIDHQEKTLSETKEVKKVDNKKTTKKSTKTTSTVTKTKTTSYEKPGTSSATGEAIANYAKSFKGLPYKSGTQSLSSGADCSGFTMLIYREFGISLPRSVAGQKGRGKEVSKGNLQKGDLVFYKPKGCRSCKVTHVAIYIGGGQIVHETRPGRGVAITAVDGLSNIQYVTARRVINSSSAKVVEQKKENKTDTTTNNTNTTNNTTTIVNEEKNENVNNNVVEDTKVADTTVTTEIPKEEVVTTEVSKETVKEEPKVETEKKEESKKEEVVETNTNTESN